MLSPCYVQTDSDVAGWKELLSRLGVRDGLVVRKEKRTLTSEELVREENTQIIRTDQTAPTEGAQYLLVAWTPRGRTEALSASVSHCDKYKND